MVIGYYPTQIYRITLRLPLTSLHAQVLHDLKTPVQMLACYVLGTRRMLASRRYWPPTSRSGLSGMLLCPVGTKRQEDHAHAPGS